MGHKAVDQSDFLLRGVLAEPSVRFSLAETTDTVATAVLVHDADPVAASIVGRAITSAALLAPLLEEGQKFTLRWEYEGRIGSVLVDVNSSTHIRGIPRKSHLMEPGTSERALYGSGGRISILKSENGTILNSGTAEAGLLDVVDDVGYFFSTSYQIETELVATLRFRPDPSSPVSVAAGFMLQAMPGCDLERFAGIRTALKTDAVRNTLALPGISWNRKLESILGLLPECGYGQESPLRQTMTVEASPPPSYTCGCSREKMMNAVKLLDADELADIFRTEGKAEVTCEFCNSRYEFSQEDLGITT